MRPHGRIRVMESLMTDRFHTTSSLGLVDQVTPGARTTFTLQLPDRAPDEDEA